MSLLVALGTSAAFGYSLCSMLLAAVAEGGGGGGSSEGGGGGMGGGGGGGVYFETSALIITFVLMGKWLEVRVWGLGRVLNTRKVWGCRGRVCRRG